MSDEYGHRLKGFTLRMENDLKAKVKESAELNDRSESDEIRERLKWSFEQDQQKQDELAEIKQSLVELHRKIDALGKEG